MGHPPKGLADLTAGIIMIILGRSFLLSFLCSFPPYSIQILFYPIANYFCVIFPFLSFWLSDFFSVLSRMWTLQSMRFFQTHRVHSHLDLGNLAQPICWFVSILLLVSRWKKSLKTEWNCTTEQPPITYHLTTLQVERTGNASKWNQSA